MSSQNERIIVVGAGPVGLTAALALGRRGIPTVLLAAEPELVHGATPLDVPPADTRPFGRI